jgi:phosphoenolpyruvate carboxykinase (GTP)
VTSIDKTAWTSELALHTELFAQLAYHLPPQLQETRQRIENQLAA